MTSSAKTQLAFAALLFIASLAAYGSWYAIVSARSAEAAQLATDIQTKDQDASKLQAAKAALASLEGDEAAIGAHFVSTADVVPFLEGLQAEGSKLGTTVSIASVSADTDATRPTLALSLQINGSFSAVLRTLGAVEYAPYFVSVSDLSLSTAPATPATASAPAEPAGWSATVSLVVGAVSSASSTPAKPAAATSTATTTDTETGATVDSSS